ncbi:unnamed protein product [Paramecium octaurelia]|uniref:Uncharacterized protein n=1 Tax=Paramecium octaurelia TaxID=43137 RepID=A0A8S1XP19_PAROT|nr:unnamed protein product [Paramecium octaurelia]
MKQTIGSMEMKKSRIFQFYKIKIHYILIRRTNLNKGNINVKLFKVNDDALIKKQYQDNKRMLQIREFYKSIMKT